MRLSIVLLLLAVGGCATVKPRENIVIPASKSYLLVTDVGAETCYIRYLATYALDSVCIDGDEIRYSPVAVTPIPGRSLPVTVTTLFNRVPIENILAERRIDQEKMLMQLAVDSGKSPD
jgi:hypothetical protein